MSIIKKLRFLIRFLTAIVKKQYRIIFLGILLGALSFVIFPKVVKYLPVGRKTVKIGLVGQYSVNNLPEEVLGDISFGLTRLSEKGEVLPGLAESWTAEDEGKKYIFKIKNETFVWHDGKAFKPTDINYNFKDVSFSLNGDTLTFTLKEPFAPFPSILAKPLFKKGLVGLGPYQVKKIERNGKNVKSILLTPYDNPSLPNKFYRFYNSESDLKTAFNLGEVNNLENVASLDGLYLGPSVQATKKLMEDAYLGVFFDTSRPPFSEKTFRQALAYSIVKETGETRAYGPLSPNSWAYNPDVKPYSLDFAHAKQLLGQDQAGQEKEIIITTLPQYETVANLVKDSWKQIGIKAAVQIVTFVPENFEVLIVAREISKDPDQYYFWHSTQAGNLSNFKSPRIDKLLEDGRKTISEEERKNIYFDFQRFLIEESPVVFLIHPQAFTVTRN